MYKRAGRWLDKPKAEHEIVLRAVEIANSAFRRVVAVYEVLKALTPGEVKILEATYSAELSTTVSVVLNLLRARGCVFSPGKLGKHRYYGSPRVLDPTTPLPVEKESRRQRVLGLVRYTVKKAGRAVRMCDILEKATEFLGTSNLSPTDISRNVLSLKQKGELHLVGSIRGDGKGINFYLPADIDPRDYVLPESLTWLQAVERTFNDLWNERAVQAKEEGMKPRPISTGEVRARMRTCLDYKENLEDPMSVVNAMQQLAETKRPVVRKIKRSGHRAILWAPTDVIDDGLDLGDAYASDTERICEAVRRAEQALNRPVGLRDVQDQVDLDPTLRSKGSLSIFSILSDAAKEHISEPGGTRFKRATQKIYRAGKIADDTYYSTNRTPQAKAFIEFGRLELLWTSMRMDEQVKALDACSLPCVATGRVRLLTKELSKVMDDLDHIRKSGHLRGESICKADDLRKHMNDTLNAAHGWLNSYGLDDPHLPKEVDTNVPGWTADELLEVVRPLYPQARKLKKGTRLIPLMGDAIRRIFNPEYTNRFSKDQRLASEYLFDRTDALMYIAKEWGGYECCLQATLAANELGMLRDPRFVFPALEAPDFNARFTAIACLAFLRSEPGNEHLRAISINDPDPGVRQSALWAYGFTGAADAQEMLASRSKEDTDVRVRAFAHELLRASQDSWWLL
ncbi:MAG TPA: HEAT repeat domain-containing protein [Pyrinomonadaceae bacterium]